jgi:DNA polymerase alpha subunit A
MSRRAKQQNSNKLTALERLKERRAAGSGGLSTYDVNEEDAAIYDEINEADYQLLMRKRLQEDDFVVDDDGLGYVDYGNDDADAADPMEHSSDEDGKSFMLLYYK